MSILSNKLNVIRDIYITSFNLRYWYYLIQSMRVLFVTSNKLFNYIQIVFCSLLPLVFSFLLLFLPFSLPKRETSYLVFSFGFSPLICTMNYSTCLSNNMPSTSPSRIYLLLEEREYIIRSVINKANQIIQTNSFREFLWIIWH